MIRTANRAVVMTMASRENDLEQGLGSLRLTHMAQILKETLRVSQQENWSCKRFLRWLIEEEMAFRKSTALTRRIRNASIPEKWTLETFPFHLQSGVDHRQINHLAELDFVREGMNLAFVGKTGVGKTGLASSLLLKALLNGYTGLRQKVQEMLDDLRRSIADRRTKYLLTRLSRLDVLLCDEMGYLRLDEDQANLFFTLMDNRYRAHKATIITTNMGYDEWGKYLKNAPMTAALVSRFRQRCTTIVIVGPDLRSLQGEAKKEEQDTEQEEKKRED
jgi:DNA replication protein DnaC